MPEMHINGRSSIHNSSIKIDDLGTTQDTSSGSLVTADSYNSTIAINTPTNTLDHHNLLCGVVPLFVYICLAFLIMITIALCLAKKRKKSTTQGKAGSKLSFQMEPLFTPNAIQLQQTQ